MACWGPDYVDPHTNAQPFADYKAKQLCWRNVFYEDLHVHFPIREGFLVHRHATVKAVNDIRFTLDRGDVFGLVGESGCGKTTLGRAVVGLAPVTAGNIYFNGRSIVGLHGREAYERARHIQLIFQDPYSSLHPRKTVCDLLGVGLKLHALAPLCH